MGKLYGIDIREHGSKSAGMTNVNRTLGSKQAAVVFVVDVLKAVFAFVVVPMIVLNGEWSFQWWTHIFPQYQIGQVGLIAVGPRFPALYAGLGAILGHNFPFYLKFRGGKGIACTLGVILMLDLRIAIITFAVGLVLVLVFRYISLASLAITFLAPVLLYAYYVSMFSFNIGIYRLEVTLILAVIGALAWYMHRENIKRLRAGTESKFSLGKKATQNPVNQ